MRLYVTGLGNPVVLQPTGKSWRMEGTHPSVAEALLSNHGRWTLRLFKWHRSSPLAYWVGHSDSREGVYLQGEAGAYNQPTGISPRVTDKLDGPVESVVSPPRYGWDAVQRSWFQAKSLVRSLASKGVAQKRVDPATKSLRIFSCHGEPCKNRAYSHSAKHHYCNACGCGEREVARISAVGSELTKPVFDEDYDKLDYPYLECPLRKPGFSNGIDLANYFDRVVVLSLKRREDRRQRLEQELVGWPFKHPELFEAVDGRKVPPPASWGVGGPAWGCMQGHRQILEKAIQDDVKRLLVLEDDVCFCPDFAAKVREFICHVPDDWEQLMIGGQLFHDSHEEIVAPGVRRVTQCERTHCYALQGNAIKALYLYWHAQTTGHCDWSMGDWQELGYKVYAPETFLAGQDADRSDISGALNPRKFWKKPKAYAPVVLLRTSRDTMEQLRSKGFHSGYTRDPDTGFDVGLRDLFAGPESERPEKLRKWIDMIKWEAATAEGTVCTVWHPDCTTELIELAAGKSPVLIESQSVDDAVLRKQETCGI